MSTDLVCVKDDTTLRVRFSLPLYFWYDYKYNKVNIIHEVSLHFLLIQECGLRNPHLLRPFPFFLPTEGFRGSSVLSRLQNNRRPLRPDLTCLWYPYP